MSDYILRDIDEKVWAKARARAILEGRKMSWVLRNFIEEYANHRPKKKKEVKDDEGKQSLIAG